MTFYEKLDRYGANIALVEEGRPISYAGLQNATEQFAQHVPAGKLVFVVCKNNVATVTGYLGLLQKKAVPALIAATLASELFDSLLKLYKPEYLWAPEGFYPGKIIYKTEGYALISTGYTQEVALHKDLALLLTTSGSTGSPKLVRQSYRNISSNAASIAEYLHIQSTDRAITTLPMNYTYGLSIIQSHLLMGAAVILTECSIMEKEFWRLLKEERATTFGGVPYTYEMLKKLRFLRMDLPHIRYLTQAGGKLGKEMHAEFAEGLRAKGIDFIVMYGQAEATARMTYVPADQAAEKAGSIGLPIPGGKISLVDGENHIIETADTVGELVYEGPNVTLGYANCPEDLSLGDERQGVLFTGDMAKRDADGYYYIVGRKKRFLKMFGNRVNLDELEGLLHKDGFEVACAGEDDHLCLFSTHDDEALLVQRAAELTGINRSAFSYRQIPRIPRNESGKVLYSQLIID